MAYCHVSKWLDNVVLAIEVEWLPWCMVDLYLSFCTNMHIMYLKNIFFKLGLN